MPLYKAHHWWELRFHIKKLWTSQFLRTIKVQINKLTSKAVDINRSVIKLSYHNLYIRKLRGYKNKALKLNSSRGWEILKQNLIEKQRFQTCYEQRSIETSITENRNKNNQANSYSTNSRSKIADKSFLLKYILKFDEHRT